MIRMDTTLSVDFTREALWSGLAKSGSSGRGCRVTGQKVDVLELQTSGWRCKSQQSAEKKRGNGFPKMLVD